MKSTKPYPAANSPALQMRVRITVANEIGFGPGKAELLEAIKATGSISAAGKTMDMSYRRAWMLVDSMNRCFQSLVVETAKGGKNGGGAQITAFGEEVLKRYRNMEAAMLGVAEEHFKNFAPLLRSEPLLTTGGSAEQIT